MAVTITSDTALHKTTPPHWLFDKNRNLILQKQSLLPRLSDFTDPSSRAKTPKLFRDNSQIDDTDLYQITQTPQRQNPAGAAHLVALMINGLDCEAIQDIFIQ